MMVNRTRDCTRQFYGYVADSAIGDEAMKWCVGYVYCCKAALRWQQDVDKDMTGFLSEAELAALRGVQHMPNYCMDRLTDQIALAKNRGLIDTIQVRDDDVDDPT